MVVVSRPYNADNLFVRKPFLFHAGPPQVEENLTYQMVQISSGTPLAVYIKDREWQKIPAKLPPLSIKIIYGGQNF